MPKVIQDIVNNFQDFSDNVNRATDGSANIVGTIVNPLNTAILNGRNLSRDTKRFGEDLNGTTARNAANVAAGLQEQAQADAEEAQRHQELITQNAAAFRAQKDSQRVKQLVASGRGGTLMNGTGGYETGTGDTTGGPSGGSKTLLGR